MRDKDLKGIPQSITRTKRDALLAELGLGDSIDRLISLEFHHSSIHAEMIATDDRGYYLVEKGELRFHKIIIPVVAEVNDA